MTTSPIEQTARAGGFVLALGTAGVMVTSAFYGISPPQAALPVIPVDFAAAASAAPRGQATMHLAGLFGVLGDVLYCAAGLLLGAIELVRGRGFAAIGWFLIAISGIVFVGVDALVGFVLAQSANEAAFAAVKRLFDVLFLLGTATFGLGVLAAFAGRLRAGENARLLYGFAVAMGCVATLSGLAGLLGMAVNPHILGISIAGSATLFTVIGIRYALTGRS
ncbi:MAG: hypothetical protein LBQ20_02315 [Rhodanobacter sp.]|jgi:hypothetical protein|nr:hypothetical protein [Rhodanobacter sp.]